MIAGPEWGFSSPIEQFVMWTFYDKKPDKDELLSSKYHGKMEIEKLSIDDDVENCPKNGRCVTILKDIHKAEKRRKTKHLLSLANGLNETVTLNNNLSIVLQTKI